MALISKHKSTDGTDGDIGSHAALAKFLKKNPGSKAECRVAEVGPNETNPEPFEVHDGPVAEDGARINAKG